MADWAPGTTHFKEPKGSAKVDRFHKRMKAKAKEDDEKGQVRKRDKRCRFPLCGCKKFQLALHVSHRDHKGMGGNRTGDRSEAWKMIYVCSARHRENRFSIDRRTIRWRELEEGCGADGPVAWDIDPDLLGGEALPMTADGWAVLAVERTIGVYEPVTPVQKKILLELAGMRL